MAVDKFEITGSWESVDGDGFELTIEREGPVYVGKMSVLGENADSETIRADSLEEVEKGFELFKYNVIKKSKGEMEMTNEKMDLSGLVMELDGESGSLNLAISTIEDIEINFGQVVDAMDNLKDPRDAAAYLREWRRDLHILSRLLHYTVKDAEEARQNIQYLKEGLFDELVRNEK